MRLWPINVRLMTQGEGAPIFDSCTTVVRGRMEDGTRIAGVYSGVAICPGAPFGWLKAVAITCIKNAYIER